MARATRVNEETTLARNLASVLHVTLAEAVDIACRLPADEQVELVVYCYSRAHLRDKGLAMAAGCKSEAIAIKSSKEIAANLLAQAAALASQAPRGVSVHNSRVTLHHGQHV